MLWDSQLVAEADAVDRELLSRAPKFRAQMERLGVLYQPDAIEYAIDSRARRAEGRG